MGTVPGFGSAEGSESLLCSRMLQDVPGCSRQLHSCTGEGDWQLVPMAELGAEVGASWAAGGGCEEHQYPSPLCLHPTVPQL